MILTLTPNPTIDRVVFCRNFSLGTVVRAEAESVTPCGKGVAASVVIHELGGDTVALGLKAGLTGDLHGALLDGLGVEHDLVSARGETRTMVVLVDLAVGADGGETTLDLLCWSRRERPGGDFVDQNQHQCPFTVKIVVNCALGKTRIAGNTVDICAGEPFAGEFFRRSV